MFVLNFIFQCYCKCFNVIPYIVYGSVLWHSVSRYFTFEVLLVRLKTPMWKCLIQNLIWCSIKCWRTSGEKMVIKENEYNDFFSQTSIQFLIVPGHMVRLLRNLRLKDTLKLVKKKGKYFLPIRLLNDTTREKKIVSYTCVNGKVF